MPKHPLENRIQTLENKIDELTDYVKIIAGNVVLQQIEQIVSTDDRKVIWFLCDGSFDRDQIAKKTGIKKRTIDGFIDQCKTIGWIQEEKDKGGHPKKVIDFMSEDWKRLARERIKEGSQANPSDTNDAEVSKN